MPFVVLGMVSFLSWFVSMVAGGGSPLVLIPLVSFMYGAQAVAPVITTGMLLGNIQRLFYFWQDIDWEVTLWQLPGVIIGSILGAFTLNYINLEGLQIVIGIALLLMVANYWFGNQENTFNLKTWQFLPLGFGNSFASGLIGSTGPIMNPAYINYGLLKEAMVATKAANIILAHVIKLCAYASLGTLSKEYVIYGVVIGAAAIPANWLGQWVLSRMSNDLFKQVTFIFIAVSGVLMLWQQRQFLMVW
ncbi:sulfite exporter TauE/SafE family protein [Acaryochloris marina]|uniref:sulfite exporter TauE/SafE family protein n=1 Tax=Acaryochloris marina TaxID=155978 RepID=UPI001BAE7E3C|nr:sulfite exporter TauE/SafE family protein [Acaryochloris marina]QUY43981.1 sulfite exporter TauE/SafE family protein [Acaryochloris marina S15]